MQRILCLLALSALIIATAGDCATPAAPSNGFVGSCDTRDGGSCWLGCNDLYASLNVPPIPLTCQGSAWSGTPTVCYRRCLTDICSFTNTYNVNLTYNCFGYPEDWEDRGSSAPWFGSVWSVNLTTANSVVPGGPWRRLGDTSHGSCCVDTYTVLPPFNATICPAATHPHLATPMNFTLVWNKTQVVYPAYFYNPNCPPGFVVMGQRLSLTINVQPTTSDYACVHASQVGPDGVTMTWTAADAHHGNYGTLWRTNKTHLLLVGPGSWNDTSVNYSPPIFPAYNLTCQTCNPALVVAPGFGTKSCTSSSTTCWITCNPGFVIRGSGVFECFPNGTWIGQTATCVSTTSLCPAYSLPANTILAGTCNRDVYGNCPLTCSAGFHFNFTAYAGWTNATTTPVCLASGAWNGTVYPCVACTVCPSGKFNTSICSATADTACAACSTCTTGSTYSSAPCTTTRDVTCSACTVCPGGSYASSACTATSNTGCSACTICTLGNYASTVCSSTQNAVCTGCITGCANCTGAGVGASCVTCDVANNYGRSVSGTCILCDPALGLYMTSDGQCKQCADIAGCSVQETCTNATDSQCTQCGVNQWVLNGVADQCATCEPCTSLNYYIAASCQTAANTVCLPCSTCNGTSTITGACTQHSDTVCGPCAPIAHCTDYSCTTGSLTCNVDCDSGYILTAGRHSCVACRTCAVGTFQVTPCAQSSDTTCSACCAGCAQCTGFSLSAAKCQLCDNSVGYLLDAAGQTCVHGCLDGYYAHPGNATHQAQCTACTRGCQSCVGDGLMLLNNDDSLFEVNGTCLSCDERAGVNFRLSLAGDACVAECPAGQWGNTTVEPHFCSSCESFTCPVGKYVQCTTSTDASCGVCTRGCSACTGPGLDLSEAGTCQACDESAGYARDAATSMCVPCAANCTLCSGNPTTCTACAGGYSGTPGCAPVCESPGCLSCVSPGSCASLCDGAFSGDGCMTCSAAARLGSSYPTCVLSRVTDSKGTGITMGIIALLVVFVMIVALYRPLNIFYRGEQDIVTPAATLPLEIDYVLSTRSISLSIDTSAHVDEIYLEGAGLMPRSLPITRLDEKSPYTLAMNMTKKQNEKFLAGRYRVEVLADAGLGVVTTPYPLRIHMRVNLANCLACFTILVEFIQLSAFCFGNNISWWAQDPVPSTLHYSLIVLPTIHNLWYYVFYALTGLALFFVLMIIVIKTGIDRKCGTGSTYQSITGFLYGVILPFIGQTLYMPILSVMLSVMACSKPVTVAGQSFSANFDPAHVHCWQGDHWIYVALSVVVILTFYPTSVMTLPLWQTVNPELDVRYFPTFLTLSGQVKFILSVTSQLFSEIAFLQSILLMVFSLPVVLYVLKSPPTIVYPLRWPLLASYAGVFWVGVTSILALFLPNNWMSNAALYAGWFLIFGASIFAATKSSAAAKKTKATNPSAADALQRAMGSNSTAGAKTTTGASQARYETEATALPDSPQRGDTDLDALAAQLDEELEEVPPA